MSPTVVHGFATSKANSSTLMKTIRTVFRLPPQQCKHFSHADNQPLELRPIVVQTRDNRQQRCQVVHDQTERREVGG